VGAAVSAGSGAQATPEMSQASAILMRRALLKAGMPEERADALLKRAERITRESETLQAADGSGSLADVEAQRAAIRDLGVELRKQLGEEDYDWFLYASGISNRMVVHDAPGPDILGDIDLKPGDILLSYDGTRVLRPSELQRLSREGERGARVKVELLRQGEVIATSLPRGPLGVTFSTARLTP
jgi:S1-C subfamily serine protease